MANANETAAPSLRTLANFTRLLRATRRPGGPATTQRILRAGTPSRRDVGAKASGLNLVDANLIDPN